MSKTRVALAVALVALATPTGAQDGAFKVIVNRSNDVASLSSDDVAKYFMKAKTKWPSGEAVKPVDQRADSPVRSTFTKTMHNKSVTAIQSFWRAQIFVGRILPPPEAPSDAVVLGYVGENPGAIGYVSYGTTTGAGVKVLSVLKDMK
jgi:ABC-type phosphate transport system substrate-binding protein